MNNKITIMFLFIVMILIMGAGCENSTQKYLEFSENQNPIIRGNENYNLKFFVFNPTQNTFVGTIEYEYDEGCISTSSNIDEIEITPKEYKKAEIKSFSYNTGLRSQICLQKPLKITTILKDKGGEIKAKFDVSLTIVE